MGICYRNSVLGNQYISFQLIIMGAMYTNPTCVHVCRMIPSMVMNQLFSFFHAVHNVRTINIHIDHVMAESGSVYVAWSKSVESYF